MSFLDTQGSGSLEDALSQSANDQSNTIKNQYAQTRRKSIAQAGASGRLRSGVYNYQAGDINAGEAGDLGNVQSALSSALAQVPLSDFSATQDAARQRQLAELLASLNKSSPLEEALGGIGAAGQLAATYAAFA